MEKGESMKKKEWLREGKYTFGVYDHLNYYVGKINIVKEGKKAGEESQDMRFFKSPALALKYMADQIARTKADSLREYLDELRAINSHLESLTSV